MSDPLMGQGGQSRGVVAIAGAVLALAAGSIHLLLTPEHFEEAAYLGVLFALDFVGSAVAAFGIVRGRRWGWILGAVVAAGAFVAYLVDGAVGLPGMDAGGLLEPVGVLAKNLEALFLAVCAFELVPRFGRRALALGVAGVLAVTMLAAALILLGAAPAEHDEPAPERGHHDE